MKPVSRKELIYRLRKHFNFSGPFSGGKHSFMQRGQLRLRTPNPHQKDIGASLLKELLQQAGISRKEWE